MYKKFYCTGLLLVTITCLQAQNEKLLFSPKGIAEIHITLAGGKQIWDIKNEKANDDYAGKVKGSMTVINSATSTYSSKDFYSGNILIDGRGNTSWHHDKRPYNIDLVKDDWETDTASVLLGMPAGDEWCLLAFWMDRSLMRFQIASYLGQRMTGIDWTPRNRYVEVWINNDYRGFYALSEKIQRDDNRVDVKKLEAASTNLSGGYILEASSEEKLKPLEIQKEIKSAKYDINFSFKYPKPQNITEAQRAWIKNYIDEYETVLQGSDYKNPAKGYAKYISVSSFIDWTMLYELSKGCDNLFHASIFLQKDRDKKLNMGAPWDFDLSYGNSGVYAEEGTWVRTHRWFGRLYQDPAYAEKFNQRFVELLPLFDSIPQIIHANYEQLETSGVLEREYTRFPSILNDCEKYGDGYKPSSYKAHVRYLNDWIMSRKNWVYLDLSKDDTEKGQRMTEIKPAIRVMEPDDMYNLKSFDVKVMRTLDGSTDYKYSWNNSSFGNSNTRTISQKGKYWVKIKDPWGNVSLASDTLYFGVEPPIPSAINNIREELKFTYTNPANNFIVIRYSVPANDSKMEVGLWNTGGQQVLDFQFNTMAEANQILVPVANLPRGMYILRLHTKEGFSAKKVILK
ncbi:hypothetical protein FACS189413_13050 [Bacteroidia bacterium]|nr:hypothetical protein FACS189413_13050 [Bacteroidia bacterium]